MRDTEQSYQINEKLSDKRREVRALKFIIHSWDHGSVRYWRWGLVLMPDRTGGERQLSGNWRENILLNDPIIGGGMITNISLIVQKLSYKQRYYIN